MIKIDIKKICAVGVFIVITCGLFLPTSFSRVTNPVMPQAIRNLPQQPSALGMPDAATVEGTSPFDTFLDQVIMHQDPSGTLPALAPPTLRGTFLAVQALYILGFPADVDPTPVQAFVLSCLNDTSHLFADTAINAIEHGIRVSGYSTIEATYYALAMLELFGALQPPEWQETANALIASQDGSGGFACRPGVCTTHDAYFAYKALQLLGDAGMANVDALASFLDGRQASDPARWWEYGAFTNLPPATGEDADFTEPNVVTSFYAVATLAACGRSSVLNEAALVGFMGLLKNMSSNLYSYATGNERAEHVGTAHLLALDQYLTGDASIDYAAAGSALISRLDTGTFNEGRKAPANHTLSAACEVVWGLSEGGRLGEVSTATKEKLREFISLHLVASGSMAGYALTRLAAFHELANLLPAITGAGKVDTMNVNGLYAFIRGLYSKVLAYFSADGTALLQRDLPACYNPSSPDGAFASGIATTLPALQTLKAIGRLNDFLGETHDTAKILGNITASQFLNASAPAVHGAFCPQSAFARECKGNEGIRALINPQWTVQALEAIAILDPTAPASHFDAGAAWQYLSQSLSTEGNAIYFNPPSYVQASTFEWTCRMATALSHAGMQAYFNITAVGAWLVTHLNGSSLADVANHLRFVGASGSPRGNYTAEVLSTLPDSLSNNDGAWYHSQGVTWPDFTVVGNLAQLQLDRQLYLRLTVPPVALQGGSFEVTARVTTLFYAALADMTVQGTFANVTSNFTGTGNGFVGIFHVPYSYRGAVALLNVTASKRGWLTDTCNETVQIDGRLLITFTCGEHVIACGGTCNLTTATVLFQASFASDLGGTWLPAEVANARIQAYAGEFLFVDLALTNTSVMGIYAVQFHLPGDGCYNVILLVDGIPAADCWLQVTLQGGSSIERDQAPIVPAALILLAGGVGGLGLLGAGGAVYWRYRKYR